MSKPFELGGNEKQKRVARQNYQQPRANVDAQRPNWAPGVQQCQAPTGTPQLPAMPRAPVAVPFRVR